ncbi:MAG TPA: SHOCT domain-containing protein [Thermoanaerobaculia bacterium]|nr:SHOCT domain-containing protein [Thermoanaerobaculia bacterium]
MVIIIGCIATAAVARDATKELAVPLRFAAQESVASNSADLPPAVMETPVVLRVEDGRGPDPMTIGHGTNDDDERFPIRSSVDVLPFISDTAKQVAGEWGVKQTPAADRTLTLRLTRFYVEESNKAVGSMYAAEVKFAYSIADKAGKKLYEGISSGSARRYGRARSADNCNEVLSDSLKEALANALSDATLHTAWVTGKPAASGAAAATSESVEERLRKLDELLQKKLITKEEYDKKRAEILKDL